MAIFRSSPVDRITPLIVIPQKFCAQIGSVEVAASADSLYPAVGMHSLGEEVLLDLNAEWRMEEEDGQMIVDSHEEDWGRLHDVQVTGTVSLAHTEDSVCKL